MKTKKERKTVFEPGFCLGMWDTITICYIDQYQMSLSFLICKQIVHINQIWLVNQHFSRS